MQNALCRFLGYFIVFLSASVKFEQKLFCCTPMATACLLYIASFHEKVNLFAVMLESHFQEGNYLHLRYNETNSELMACKFWQLCRQFSH